MVSSGVIKGKVANLRSEFRSTEITFIDCVIPMGTCNPHQMLCSLQFPHQLDCLP